ncbi:LOW QUALITY PROTEIN: ataxin-2 homolog [Drosophila rhopaloa]|uniref:Ataxin-2 homolog n=1 Tax=Drosophila rhopaloa TaxID=1041015 RepID=A0A6P4E7R1_DRORH|nr:LOW QUALITY PROTEIN: ataxin-2 homolog [Drosophila rhopaloa]
MSDVEQAIRAKQPPQLDCGIDDETDPGESGAGTGGGATGCGSEVGARTTASLTAKPGSGIRRCCGHILKLLLSTPGLVLLVIGYSVLGALIFPLLEAPQDLSKSAAIVKSREDCLRELWIITEKLNVLYERNWTMLVHEQLRRFEGSIVAATRQGSGGSSGGLGGGGGGGLFQGGSASALGHFGYDAGDSQSWTFSEALLYSVTVITTIGHGSLTPRTAAGKLATIFYALVGVPLMLMCLSSLGALLADGLQCTYVRLCCQLQRHQEHRRKSTPGTSTPTASTAMTPMPLAKSRMKDKGKGSKRRMANCKGCKYDAANSETSLNDCLDYGQKGKLPPDKKEGDACQLLRNLNQQQHFYQQQQQQQQQQLQLQQQQQPDVMLMTTTSGSALLKYAPQQQQLQQQLSTATLPRQHHQLQQQHHQLQLQQHQPHQQHPQQLQQNFVAVPSSMLRMPMTVPPNCYAPATATIYFPFGPAPSAPGSPAHVQSHPNSNANANANPIGNHSLSQQPLVKYHTIHLQPASGKHRVLASGLQDAAVGNLVTGSEASTLEAITLPPPPAYQTANVHAVRRAKFVTKPLPHEINALMDCSTGSPDLSGRHDLLPPPPHSGAVATGMAAAGPLLTYTAAATSPQLSSGIKGAAGTGATPTAAATLVAARGGAAATLPDNSFMAAGFCGMVGAAPPPPPPPTTSAGAATTTASSAAATLSALLSANSSGTVDIMEDEDELERERLSNCPHGTPSRVPLIASPLSVPQDSAAGQPGRSHAPLHRHPLQPLGRKTLLLTRRCHRHASGTLYDSTANNTETSDDEEYMQHGSEQFVLKKLRYHCDAQDCREAQDSEDSEDDEEAEGGRQVPISLVLLILACYICVGTVIFALWENWSLVDGAYFCFVTLSTIGYGDFVPARSFNGPELQLYACCAYLLLGLVLVAMSFSILETQLMWKCKRIAVRLKLARTDA